MSRGGLGEGWPTARTPRHLGPRPRTTRGLGRDEPGRGHAPGSGPGPPSPLTASRNNNNNNNNNKKSLGWAPAPARPSVHRFPKTPGLREEAARRTRARSVGGGRPTGAGGQWAARGRPVQPRRGPCEFLRVLHAPSTPCSTVYSTSNGSRARRVEAFFLCGRRKKVVLVLNRPENVTLEITWGTDSIPYRLD